MILLYASNIYTKFLPAFGCPKTVCLWIKLVYQPLDGRLSSTGMVICHKVFDRVALPAALCGVPFSGAFCVFLNILLSVDSSTRLHDYYLDHSSQWKTIPAVIICHYTIKFLPLKKTAWRCLLLFWACRSRVPSRVSKYSPIRRFKYVTSWLLFRSLVSITYYSCCHCYATVTSNSFHLRNSLPVHASIGTSISYVTQNFVDSPVTPCLISCRT